MASFEKEKGRVVLLMQRLGTAPDEYRDPNTTAAGETGADVVAVIGGRCIGIQVTDLGHRRSRRYSSRGRNQARARRRKAGQHIRHMGTERHWQNHRRHRT